MNTKKPVIGMIPLYDEEKDSIWMLPGYMDGIYAVGGIPVILPLHAAQQDLEELDLHIDGYLLTGGHDVNPELYGEKKKTSCGNICNSRDELERIVYQIAYKKDKPVLGICRGIQLLNVLHGGALYQDIPEELMESTKIDHHMTAPYDRAVHGVQLYPGSPIQQLLHMNYINVNSYHHQGIRKIGQGLEVMATAEDGLIEGIYVPDKRFIWGIQWHPEFIFQKDDNEKKILNAFVEACL